MGTLSQCFPHEIESEGKCPTNSNCSSHYGMCVCQPGFYNNGTACSDHRRYVSDNEAKHFNASHNVQFNYEKNSTNSSKTPQSFSSKELITHLPKKCKNEEMQSNETSLFTTIKAIGNNSNSKNDNASEQLQERMITLQTIAPKVELILTNKSKLETKDKSESIAFPNVSSYIPWQLRFSRVDKITAKKDSA